MSAAAAVVKLMIRTRPVASVTVREKRGAVHRQRRPPYAADVGAAAERGRQERLRARPPQILSAVKKSFICCKKLTLRTDMVRLGLLFIAICTTIL